MPKTWNQKLNIDRRPEVGLTERKMMGIQPGMKMLVPTPILVRDYIAALPNGKAATVDQMKKDLAKQHGADCVCPLTTGIFVRIVAEATASNDKAPSHRVFVGRAEIGAAWSKRSEEGRDYLSLKLDDSSFNAPIYANLFDDEGGEGYTLLWSRPRKNGE